MHTIFAPATPPGRSGVAVLRVSGKNATRVFSFFSLPCPAPRQATLVTLINPHTQAAVDKALALYFPAPASFTGEDVVELHLHGSRAVMQEMLQLLGGMEEFRFAEPGEFSRRAFYHQKMDLTQAEAVADLIDAQTEAQKRQALRQMEGALGRECEKLRRAIIEVRAHSEAYLDFPDEEIPDSVASALNGEIQTVMEQMTKMLGDGRTGEKIREGYYAVILGVPNAGKSTLINALARRDVAIVSQEAGTTRDVIEVQMDIEGLPLTLADTAGLRDDAGAIEAEGIRRAKERAQRADFRVILLDVTQSRNAQEGVLAQMKQDDVVVINKLDANPLHIDEFADIPHPVPVSALHADGLANLISRLKHRMEMHGETGQEALITRARHRTALENAVAHLRHSLLQDALELKSEELRLAGQELGKMVGAIHIEDVLDVVFSSFCIGK